MQPDTSYNLHIWINYIFVHIFIIENDGLFLTQTQVWEKQESVPQWNLWRQTWKCHVFESRYSQYVLLDIKQSCF